ncbi:hypothetical protein [Fodinibius sp. SL11]|uniref:hypothetical protein n=1 Tax=Fodinibius sp. SL11 TaxID=3425690 RepID=UPI003F884A23
MTFSDVLIEITGGKDPLCTVSDVAEIMRKETSTVYGYRSARQQPNWDDAVALAKWLIKEHDYYRLALQTLFVCSGGSINGRIDDEILSIMEACVKMRKGFNSDNKAVFENGFGVLTSAVENLKAEGDQI